MSLGVKGKNFSRKLCQDYAKSQRRLREIFFTLSLLLVMREKGFVRKDRGLLVADGRKLYTVCKLFGHISEAITQIYGDVVMDKRLKRLT